MKIEELITLYSKDDIYDIYIVQNKKFTEAPNILGISSKDFRKLLRYYHIKKDLKLARKNNTYKRTHEESVAIGKKSALTQRTNWINKTEKEKQNWKIKCKEVQLNLSEDTKARKKELFQTYWYNLPEEEKQKINNKRSIACKKVWENPTTLKKQKETYKNNRAINGTQICRSNAEQQLYNTLIELYPGLEYDVKVDERYPFYCDFYIPSEDLFIELNAHPSHGRMPIDYMSAKEITKYPLAWHDTFKRRDVLKFEKAKENNLNYIRIYPQASFSENMLLNEEKYSELVKLCLYSQHKK